MARKARAELIRSAKDEGDRIRSGFLSSIRKRVFRFLTFRGENLTLSREIHRRFGWTIRMPAPFAEQTEHLDEGFFSMKMDRPGRLVFVYWRDGVTSLPNGDEVVALRDRLGRKYYDEDVVELNAGQARRDELTVGATVSFELPR